jgi:hypothetical protein
MVFEVLRHQFSSGVTIRELCSVAEVLASQTGVPPPGRVEKRSFQALMAWFVNCWAVVAPWLPVVTLCDDKCRPITGNRERQERRAPWPPMALYT